MIVGTTFQRVVKKDGSQIFPTRLTQVITDAARGEGTVNQLPQVPVQIVQVGLPSTDTAGARRWDLTIKRSKPGMDGTVQNRFIYDTTLSYRLRSSSDVNKFEHQNRAKVRQSASFGRWEAFAFLDGAKCSGRRGLIGGTSRTQGQTVLLPWR